MSVGREVKPNHRIERKVMDLRELLELMAQMSKVTQTRVCLGIRVCEDGSGRSIPGTLPNVESGDFPYGKSKLEWDSPAEGARQLEEGLLRKFLAACAAHRTTEQE